MFLRVILLLVGVALGSCGCAEQLQLVDRGPAGGVSPVCFWPPPPSSATWVLEPPSPARDEPLSSVAGGLELGLRGRGYLEQRWYPIGAGNSHGFAVTTRLEQVEDDAGHEPRERWTTLHADAANLRWLLQARTPPLPRPGRYRVFLVSYTDLPIGRTPIAPIWNDETLMDWPNAAHSSSPREAEVPARAPAGYRLGIYQYEYVWDDVEARGRLLPADPVASKSEKPPPAPLLDELGLTLGPSENRSN